MIQHPSAFIGLKIGSGPWLKMNAASPSHDATLISPKRETLMESDTSAEEPPRSSEKTTLRRMLIDRRNRIDEADRATRSISMCGRLSAYLLERLGELGPLEGCHAPSVALYAAMGSEPSLDRFAFEAMERGWRCFFPVMVKDAPEPSGSPRIRMEFVRLMAEPYRNRSLPFLTSPAKSIARDQLVRLGLQSAEAKDLDAVVVPLVGFDQKNNRLGYGGGNYDRLLAETRPNAVVVGFAFVEQRCSSLPVEPHDIPLPRIITG